MRYVSIDLETTGLDPSTCQILEMGAVYDDGRPLKELQTFRRLVKHDMYVGEPFALAMNADLLREAADTNWHVDWVRPNQLIDHFIAWLRLCGITGRFTVAGKNFASFDNQFLKLLPGYAQLRMNHRVIDPAMLYMTPEDDVPPNMRTCCERAGVRQQSVHRAVDDAMTVVQLVREGLNR